MGREHRTILCGTEPSGPGQTPSTEVVESAELEAASHQPEAGLTSLSDRTDSSERDAALVHERVHGIESGRKCHQQLVILTAFGDKLLG